MISKWLLLATLHHCAFGKLPCHSVSLVAVLTHRLSCTLVILGLSLCNTYLNCSCGVKA